MLKKLISTSFEHALFTLSFIAGVQLPEFIQQYTQMVNGKLAEAQFHLGKFTSVADSHFNGDIELLVSRYINNADPAIKQTGIVVSELVERVSFLKEQLAQLTQGSYIEKLYYFMLNVDVESAELTARHYQLAIPLTVEALVTGVIFAFLLILILKGTTGLLTRRSSHKQLNNLH